MSSFKKILIFIISCSMVFSMISCNSKKESGNKTKSSLSSISSEKNSSSTLNTSSSSDTSTSSSSSSTDCSHVLETVSSLNPTEEADGYINYKCKNCGQTSSKILPKLSAENYTLTTVTNATCMSNKVVRYSSSEYGTYDIEQQNTKANHTTYGGLCETCNQTINNLYFEGTGTQVSDGGGYPRLYELSDGTWLCGWDVGKIMVARSTDNGVTWSGSTQVSPTNFNDYNCANVSFYQMSTGEILCSYRVQADFATADSEGRLYKREIHTSISRDNGYTWEYVGLVCGAHNYKNEPTIHVDITGKDFSYANNAIKAYSAAGMFEPFMGEINGEIVCWYADDITPMIEAQRGSYKLDYETQYICQKTLNVSTMTWGNRRVIHDGTIIKTCAEGITDYSRDGMPVFAKLNLPEHEGWYVNVIEGTYRRRDAWGNHDFIILMSLSKDNGQTWSTPIEIFVPHYDHTKASAPYVCVTEDDRLIISFQTEEDCRMVGLLGGKHPDAVSVMKVIISDGTPVDQITGPENFYDAVNPFNAPPASCTSWNGMMLVDDEIWCCTGSNYPTGSIRVNKSKIPVIDTSSKTDSYTEISSSDNITVKSGEFKKKDSWIVATNGNSLATLNNTKLINGTISCDIIPNRNCDSGIIFKASSTQDSFWEANSSYYTLLINKEGILLLGKVTNGTWSLPAEYNLRSLSTIYKCYINMNKVYNLKVIVNGNTIKCYVNDMECISYTDSAILTGDMVGIRTGGNTYFTNIVVTDSTERESVTYTVNSGTETKNGSVTINGTTIQSTSGNALCTVNGQAYDGTITCTVKPNTANDCGIVFRITACSDNYWEQEGTSYYTLLINSTGWVLLGKITNGVWSCPANYDMTGSFDASKEYELKVELDGDIIKCYVDGVLRITLTDSSIKGAGFGVRSASSGTEFRDFTVTA